VPSTVAAPPQILPSPPRRGNVAITPRGRQVQFQPEVVELDSLIASQNPDISANPAFSVELQPRSSRARRIAGAGR
jgi:hypothetical protein